MCQRHCQGPRTQDPPEVCTAVLAVYCRFDWSVHSLLMTINTQILKTNLPEFLMEHNVPTDIYRIHYTSHSSPDRKQSHGSHGDSSAGASILATAQNNSMYDFFNTLSLYCVRDQQQACPSKNGGATEARMSLGV